MELVKELPSLRRLEDRISSGTFDSRLEEYLETHFRNELPSEDFSNFYHQELAKNGRSAAEKSMAEWVHNSHQDVYAASVKPIAEAVLKLAKVDFNNFYDITDQGRRLSEQYDSRYEATYSRFVMFTKQAPGCGCMQPAGSRVFGPLGELGLKAIILETRNSPIGIYSTNVTLILSGWSETHKPQYYGSFSMAELQVTGSSRGTWLSPALFVGQGGVEYTVKDLDCLKYQLGIDPQPSNLSVSGLTSDIDLALGFPGAEDYFASKLPLLPAYLEDLADKLSSNHTH